MSNLRIALAQIDGRVGDLSGNAAKIEEYAARATKGGARIVVFPQLTLSGYPPGDLLLRSDFSTAQHELLSTLAGRIRGIDVIVGCVSEGAESVEALETAAARDATIHTAPTIHNAAAVIQAGAVTGFYTKEQLSTTTTLPECSYFQPGSGGGPYELAGHRVGVAIDAGSALPGAAVARLARAGAEVVVILAAAPFLIGGREARRSALADLARAHGVAIAYVNWVGGQDEYLFDGGSAVYTATGELLAEAALFREDLLILDLGTPSAAPKPEDELAKTSVPATAKVDDDLAETYQALLMGIRDYARKNGFTGVTLGLSGGLDSALVAVLAADALGPEAVTALWMPSRYSSELSRNDAETLAENLGIELLTIPIDPVFEVMLKTLEPAFAGRGPDLTEENLQARIRGNLLMAVSNKFGWLVLATSNKSETAVGYTTLYGDAVGGLAPLKDLYKSLVVRLARWRNEQEPVIPISTIERPPSAELRPDQRDTDSLPPYDLLDRILEEYLELGWSADRIIDAGSDESLVRRVIGLVDRAEYKRRQGPPGLKVTARAFGVDCSMPLTMHYHEG